MALPLATTSGSGQGVVLKFPGVITAVSSDNEVQQVTLGGNPAGGQFVLTFAGHNTAPIPAYAGAPYVYFQMVKTGLTPGPKDLSMNVPAGFGSGARALLVEVFDGPTKLGETTLSENPSAPPSGGFVDNSLSPQLFESDQSGNPTATKVLWYPIGRWTVSTGNLSLRFSSAERDDDQDWIYVDLVRVQDVASGVATLVTTAVPPASHMPLDAGFWSTPPQRSQATPQPSPGGGMWGIRGRGAGVRYLVDPAVCRSALEALPNVGAGNVSVSGDGSSISPLIVTYLAAMGGVAQPLLTCTDGQVTIARLAPGGILPTLSVSSHNGGASFKPPKEWYHDYASYPAMPTVAIHFPQARATPEYAVAGTYDHFLYPSRNNWTSIFSLLPTPSDPLHELYGYSHQTWVAYQAGCSATWKFAPLTAGDYRLSVTYPSAASLSTDVVFRVTNRGGAVLATVHADQTAALSGATDAGVKWLVLGTFTLAGITDGLAVTQSNGTSLPMLADAVRLERLSADTSIKIGPDDTVTYSAGAGWASYQGGTADAATNAPITNIVGGALYGETPASASMGIGWNVTPANQNENSFLYSNLATTLYSFGLPASWVDSDGYPTRLPRSSYDVSLNLPNEPFGSDGKAYPGFPPGDYDLWWDGTSDANLISFSYNFSEVGGSAVFPAPGHVNNTRRVHFPADPFSYGVTIALHVSGTTPVGDGTYHADIRNVRIYPAGTDPATVPKFNTTVLDRLRGSTSLRWLDGLRAIAGNGETYEDYDPPQSRITRTGPARTLDVPIAEVRMYAGTEYPFNHTRGLPLLFTTPSPHNLAMGQQFVISGYTGPPVHLSDGSDYALNGEPGYIYTLADPTKFVSQMYPHDGQTMTNVITNPAGYLHLECGDGMPLQDIVEIQNEIGADLYFNTSHTMSDDCLTRVTTYIAQNLDAGLKLLVEPSNETWNNASRLYVWFATATGLFYGGSPTDQVPATCELAYRQWGVMRAAWIAAGRSAGDFLRIFGVQHAYAGITERIASYSAAHSPRIAFEGAAGAPYWRPEPAFTTPHADSEPAWAIIDIMTPEQIIDGLEVAWTYGGYEGEAPAHKGILAGHGYADADYMSYEGGPDHVILPGGNQPYPDAGRRQRAVYRHPRFYPLVMHMLGRYQAGGMERFHFYQLSGYEHIEGGGPDVNGWAAYIGTDELPYEPGDDAQDAIQINTPNRADLIKSITGGAMKAWAALLGGGSGGLVAGSVSGAATSGTTASLSSSTPSGGTAPYTRQWTRDGVSVSGATSATLNDTGLTPGQTYSYRVRYTDSTTPTPLTATSSAFSVTTPGGSGGGGMGSIPISSVWGLRRLRLRG